MVFWQGTGKAVLFLCCAVLWPEGLCALMIPTAVALAFNQFGPGSNPGGDATCGLSLLFVFVPAPRGLSPGKPVFSFLQKPIPIRSGMVDGEPLCGCATTKSSSIHPSIRPSVRPPIHPSLPSFFRLFVCYFFVYFNPSWVRKGPFMEE